MFANEDFIAATRAFVCIRIETYENSASETMVRSLLGGSYANTAFCVFDHTGEVRLSRSGRSPSSLARRGTSEAITAALMRIGARHAPKDGPGDEPALLPDAPNFKQALNVAAGDQRLLLAVGSENEDVRRRARQALSDADLVGRFHADVIEKNDAVALREILGESAAKPGLLIVRAGPFGLEGEVMKQLPEAAALADIKRALLECNADFAASETRKVFAEHVAAGRRQGVHVEFEIPYGEDRDGDGTRDQDQRRRRR